VSSRGRSRCGVWLALGALASGCVLDDDRCGPLQERWGEAERCVCVEGTAYTPTGCVPCGDNELASAAGCVCVEGYARPSPAQACEPIPEGIGSACTSDAECSDVNFPHCQLGSPSGGYCTSTACSAPEDCGGGYACNQQAAPSFCERPPLGAGAACTSAADCAGGEATYCDTMITSSCLVSGCSVSPDSCFPGSECCDLTPFGLPTLCVAAGGCSL
jgi:hypothetical protein